MGAELNAQRPSGDTAPDVLAQALYDAHGPALSAWARRRYGDDLAEEVVQDVVLAGWRKHDQYDAQRGSERAWMFGIARNVAASRFRRDARHLRSIPTGTDVGADDPVDDAELARIVDRSLIADAVRSLSIEHREVLLAAYWERLTTKEIAARLGVPDGTVKSRLHYAMRMLRTALDERGVL